MECPYQQAAISTSETIFRHLSTSEQGLSDAEAAQRLTQNGKNELSQRGVGAITIFLRQFQSSFIYLLAGAVVLSLILKQYDDAAFIFLFILIGVLLGFWQEYRSQKAISLLRTFITNHTHVRRSGKVVVVNTTELVSGDIVLLKAGDKIPADIRFFIADEVQVDESILTGESINAAKTAALLEKSPHAYFEAKNIGFSGTLIIGGQAEGVVIATGEKTEAGGITKLAIRTETISPFHKDISRISNAILDITLVTIFLVFLLHFIVKGSAFNFGQFAVFAIALAVGVVPEALPLVITLSLSQGGLRLAKKKVVPKQLASIEDLGSIDVLCTDKTGTITEDKVTIDEMLGVQKESLLYYAALASAFLGEGESVPTAALDVAIWGAVPEETKQHILQVKRIKEFPFDQTRRRSSVVIHEKTENVLVVRGSAGEMLRYCTLIKEAKLTQFTGEKKKTYEAWLLAKESEGKRVIAVATKSIIKSESVTENDETEKTTLLGLIAFVDPLKKTAVSAIQSAKALGVSVKILSGDSPQVAAYIGKQIGLVNSFAEVMTGDDFEKLHTKEKIEAVERIHVFSRMSPTQKYSVIELLKEKHIVGYLGEGFNDAPALKLAHVGLAVANASDIAKDAADIILLNKSLSVITDGITEGRRTFANSVKYVKATLAANFGHFYALAFSSLMLPFLPMLPLQILLVNLITDFPHILIATDSVDAIELHRPKMIQLREVLFLSTVLGLVITACDSVFMGYFVHYGEKTLQTMWFLGSIFTELVFLFSVRTTRVFYRSSPSKPIILLSSIAATVTIFLPFSYFGQTFFGLIRPSYSLVLPAIVFIVMYFIATEGVKLLFYHFEKKQ